MSDSVEKIVAERTFYCACRGDGTCNLCFIYDTIQSLSRQHREEVAGLNAEVGSLTNRLIDAMLTRQAAEAALGEARELLRAQVDAHKCVLSLYRCDDEFISKQTSAAAAFLARTSKEM